MTKEALETLIGRLEVWALIFGALVVIGVAGETVFGVRIWWNNRKLQAIQHSESETLQLMVSTLNKEAGEFRAKAAQLEQQLAERHITVELRRQMMDILNRDAGVHVSIDHLTDSGADSQRYAAEVSEVFHDAKWTVLHELDGRVTWGTPVSGFIVEVRDVPALTAHIASIHADLAVRALSLTGYNVSKIPMDPTTALNVKTDLVILVGGK